MQDGTAEANEQAGAVDSLEAPTADGGDLELGSVAQAFTPVAPGTRRTIQSYSPADRTALANAIIAFITPEILAEHANAHDWHHPVVGELFFSNHHSYLNKLESYLLANGFSRFVPVPMWNPGTQIPAEFLVLDPLVSGRLNANPNQPAPSSITDPCSQPYATASAFAQAIEGWHDTVHGAVGGAMGGIGSAPGAPIFWLWHGFLDDAYHNYQACMTRRADVAGTTLTPSAGNWGTWHPTVYCLAGQYATAFQMRVEGNQGSGDDTSLNAVKVQCRALSGGATSWVSSHNGYWGSWGGVASCPNSSSSTPTNFMTAARLRVEPSQGGGDDTGANDATFKCRAGETINPGGGRAIGNWSNYATCPADSAVCGISTRVEGPQGSGDDTAMNGMRFDCCRLPWTPWYDRDDPSGNGDGEHLSLLVQEQGACPNPTAAECRRISDSKDWTQTGEKVTCNAQQGAVCLNSEQTDGSCDDYQVRFLCPN